MAHGPKSSPGLIWILPAAFALGCAGTSPSGVDDREDLPEAPPQAVEASVRYRLTGTFEATHGWPVVDRVRVTSLDGFVRWDGSVGGSVDLELDLGVGDGEVTTVRATEEIVCLSVAVAESDASQGFNEAWFTTTGAGPEFRLDLFHVQDRLHRGFSGAEPAGEELDQVAARRRLDGETCAGRPDLAATPDPEFGTAGLRPVEPGGDIAIEVVEPGGPEEGIR